MGQLREILQVMLTIPSQLRLRIKSLIGAVLVGPIALRKVSRISSVNTRPDNASATACLRLLHHWPSWELSRQPVECKLFFILSPAALLIEADALKTHSQSVPPCLVIVIVTAICSTRRHASTTTQLSGDLGNLQVLRGTTAGRNWIG